MRGMRPLEASQILIDTLDLKRDARDATAARMTAAELLAETEVQLNARWGEVQMMPGAARLLAHLSRHKVPTALATSTPSKYMRMKLAGGRGSGGRVKDGNMLMLSHLRKRNMTRPCANTSTGITSRRGGEKLKI